VLLALLVVLVVLFIVLPLIGLAAWAVISTIVVGLVIGALGRLVVPGRQAMGLLATCGCGLIGSLLGGFLGQHVLHLAGILVLLIQIGVAAAAVALIAGSRRDRLGLR
jgi:uncharacterized membrane protein YeaQ/YmgE (transglycosylase-associated protein family)